MRTGITAKVVAVLAAVVVVAAACDPGWVNPVLGTGDGTGTPVGSTPVAKDQIALGAPMSMVDLGAPGYLVHDRDDCTIVLAVNGSATHYAGDGRCGSTGDGGPATDAALRVCPTPLGSGLLADAAGNVFFIAANEHDECGKRIRRVDATTGVITQVPVDVGDGLMLGADIEPDGTLTYLLYRVDDGPDGSEDTVSDIRRIDTAGNDTLITSIATPDGPTTGFVRVGPDHHVTFSTDADGSPVRLDVDRGAVSSSPIHFDESMTPIPTTADAQGTIYGFTWSEADDTDANRVFRMGPDGIVEPIAGNGEADDGTRRRFAQGADLALSATAVEITRRGNLLIASGHVVHNLVDPARAPVVESITLGSPLNVFGRVPAIDAP